MVYYNIRLKKYARELRNNPTETEKLLWSRLRNRQLKGKQVYRQKIIGDYIVDFYCPNAKLIIEVDGGQHYTEEGLRKDKIRDAYIEKQGFKVIRFSDVDVLSNIESVIETIYENM